MGVTSWIVSKIYLADGIHSTILQGPSTTLWAILLPVTVIQKSGDYYMPPVHSSKYKKLGNNTKDQQ